MRASLQINRDLLAAAEKIASQRGQTLVSFVEETLRDAVSRGIVKPLSVSQEHQRVELPTFRGEGLRPGVRLDDSAALLGSMDSSSPAS